MREYTRRTVTTLSGAALASALAGCADDGGSQGGDDTETDAGTATDGNETTEPAGTDGNGSESTTAESEGSVSFELPESGELYTPFQVVMNAEGYTIEEAGEVNEGAGHFHVMIDTGPVEPGNQIPEDDQHRHFGDGSERAFLDLAEGEHRLVLQLGNGAHEALPATDEVTVDVVGESSVSFAAPEDGATVTNPVEIEMSAENFTVQESGEINQNAGHFHVLVDQDPVPAGEVIPNDDDHVHFGDGATTAELDLAFGEHTLVLQPGNGAHEAYPIHEEITVTVE